MNDTLSNTIAQHSIQYITFNFFYSQIKVSNSPQSTNYTPPIIYNHGRAFALFNKHIQEPISCSVAMPLTYLLE